MFKYQSILYIYRGTDMIKEYNGNIFVAKLEGKLDLNTSPDVQQELIESMVGVKDVVIDLARLTYVSSAGIRVFITVYKILVNDGGSLKIINANEEVYDILEVSGLVDIIEVERK